MTISPFQNLICPIDAEPLNINGNSWRCSNGHCFDIAKQGYSNLLPVQNKRSLDPGDHKAMVACRQRFLNAGYYQPIADAVNQMVLKNQLDLENHSANKKISCLDAGCGEGYYLRQLASANHSTDLSLIGVDISKWAVLAAAKQDAQQNANWIVASNASLPIKSESLDLLLCLFGFPVYAEFGRVLKPNGLLLQVDTGVEHLRELREIIYPTQKPDKISELKTPEGFTHKTQQNVSFNLALNDPQPIADLLAMTPHFYRASAEGKIKAAALKELTVTVDVNLNLLSLQ